MAGIEKKMPAGSGPKLGKPSRGFIRTMLMWLGFLEDLLTAALVLGISSRLTVWLLELESASHVALESIRIRRMECWEGSKLIGY